MVGREPSVRGAVAAPPRLPKDTGAPLHLLQGDLVPFDTAVSHIAPFLGMHTHTMISGRRQTRKRNLRMGDLRGQTQ